MNNLSTIFVIFLVICGSSLADLSWWQRDQIDKYITKTFLPKNNAPGLGITIVQNGKVDLVKGYGYRDVEASKPVTNDTVFIIGSVGKSICSTIAVKVLSEKFPELGERALDVPISKLAPNYNITFSDRYRSEAMNLRDLLAHRTCLQTGMFALMTGNNLEMTPQEFLYRQRYAKEVCPFRTNFVYHNQMYDLAGDVIGHLAGKSYENLLKEFLGDLGMSFSSGVQREKRYRDSDTLARPYFYNSETGKVQLSNLDMLNRGYTSQATGSVMSTPNDMSKYLLFQLNMGKVGDKQIVPKDSLDWMRKASNTFYGPNAEDFKTQDFNYGLGLFLGSHKDIPVLSHGGFSPPYNGQMSIFSKLNLAIYTVTNGPGSLSNPTHKELHGKILDIIQGKWWERDLENEPEFSESNFEEFGFIGRFEGQEIMKNSLEEINPQELEGLFGNALIGNLNLNYNSDKSLYIHIGRFGTGFLTNISPNLYKIEWNSDINYDIPGGYRAIVQFFSKDSFTLRFEYISESFDFNRNATLDTFPEKVWANDSCAP